MKHSDPPRSLDVTAVDIVRWQDDIRTKYDLMVTPIAWEDSPSWLISDGQIHHSSKKFFSVLGIAAESNHPDLDGIEQPLILQPEIGILGFLTRQFEGRRQLLMQAKMEPGNVGAVQFGPSVQATVSNYTQVHGGSATPYLSYILADDRSNFVSDILQSEEGTRFLDKYNRNVMIDATNDGPEPVSDLWRWCETSAILQLLRSDYRCNTDTRSSLVCSDWNYLCDSEQPFDRWCGSAEFGDQLLQSYNASDDQSELAYRNVVNQIEQARQTIEIERKVKAVDTLIGWTMDQNRITDNDDKEFEVNMYKISASQREVPSWDQPLVHSHQQSSSILLAQQRKGILHFLLRGSAEVGFINKVQYGTSVQEVDPTDALARLGLENGSLVEHASCLQSDEGGRFFHSIVHYQIVEIPENTVVQTDGPDLYCWVTLAQIYQLTRNQGFLTNEARSAVSLLLSWL